MTWREQTLMALLAIAAILIVVGVYLIYPPAAWIVGGLCVGGLTVLFFMEN